MSHVRELYNTLPHVIAPLASIPCYKLGIRKELQFPASPDCEEVRSALATT